LWVSLACNCDKNLDKHVCKIWEDNKIRVSFYKMNYEQIIPYNTMIVRYAMNGCIKEYIKLYVGINPKIGGCRKLEAIKLFEQMGYMGIQIK